MHLNDKVVLGLFYTQLTPQPSFAFHKEVVTLWEGYLIFGGRKRKKKDEEDEQFSFCQKDNNTHLPYQRLMKCTLYRLKLVDALCASEYAMPVIYAAMWHFDSTWRYM